MKKKKLLLQCSSQVDKIRRETIDGVEHIIISSYTMPDNIVMNGILYPAEEIAKSFKSLENTLAPIEHPVNSDGNFISATDPMAIHNFHAGAFNQNVKQENGRLHIEKFVNVQEALKSERGKRLLDRIEEIETNDNFRPIHTSTGVFLLVDELEKPKMNANKQQYNFVASELLFDHDAILLDTVGAAQPNQGVGMAVNSDGKELEVNHYELNAEDLENNPVPDKNEMSHEEIRDALFSAINVPPINGDWIDQVFESEFIFSVGDLLFSAPYTLIEGVAKIVGIPLPVERDVTFKPKTNNQKGDAMKELLVNALKAAGIETKDLDDAQLLAKYNELQANQSNEEKEHNDDSVGADSIAKAVTNALSPIVEKLDVLETKLNAKDDDELNKLAEIVGNSDKYAGLTVDACKSLKLEDLKNMAANCATSHGLPFVNNIEGGNDSLKPTEMPE